MSIAAEVTRATESAPRSLLARNLARFRRDRFALFASALLVLFILAAIFAPLIAPHDPYDSDLLRRLQPPGWIDGGEWSYPLGCDALGRDILSRIIYGTRISIFVGVAVVLLAAIVGTLAGLAAGYFGGAVDIVISRVVDILVPLGCWIFLGELISRLRWCGIALVVIGLALVAKPIAQIEERL